MADAWMVYGAYGYTGRLVLERAIAAGYKPVVAGRDPDRTESLALEFGLPHRSFELSDTEALRRGLSGMRAVLHCAGPFSATSAPMIAACLQVGTHYLDITGEIDVFAYAHANDSAARKRGVALVPGVGFDVVPTDCLAAMLKRELPDATELLLAFDAEGGPSRGTALTSVEGLGKGGRIRRDGELITVPLGYKRREIAFPRGNRQTVTIPWGDVYTAFVSTGIPNIEVYMALPPRTIAGMRRLRWLTPLLGLAPVQWFLKRRVEANISGPSESRRDDSRSYVYGEVRNPRGDVRAATLTTPNGYALTAQAALKITHFLATDRGSHAGFYTPSLLMGADFVRSLSGVEYARVR
ncbi:MAG TPA: saccharopine dehydrogenase NADP-binding domain-containing protein [Xanthomonadales bacterium]|nr:saccharopine dehydrogenase NADP-binding domain-containing protein [Xanthomonadales bacterium]